MRGPSIVRPIVVLSAAAFASVATMRVADPLIPQIAGELDVSFGDASVITTAFAISYGLCQLVWGALGDRFGKYRLVTLMTLLSAATVALAGFANSLAALGAARLVAGATAAAIVPLALAFIGDHVPYEQRQTVLGRFLTGTILGIIAGQVAGGVLGDLVGWRGVFFLLGGVFLLVGCLLVVELRSGRVPPPLLSEAAGPAALVEAYLVLLRRPWARVILVTVAIEGFLFYGAFTFVGAWLHTRFDLDYAIVGLLLGCMGLGGLTYALSVRRLLAALGERGLALVGGLTTTFAFFVVALGGLLAMAPAIVLLGLGIHMLHNTLQTNATQMTPGARGLAVSTFANVLFLGQAAGVWLCGRLIDDIGFAPVFIVSGVALAILGACSRTCWAAAPPWPEAEEASHDPILQRPFRERADVPGMDQDRAHGHGARLRDRAPRSVPGEPRADCPGQRGHGRGAGRDPRPERQPGEPRHRPDPRRELPVRRYQPGHRRSGGAAIQGDAHAARHGARAARCRRPAAAVSVAPDLSDCVVGQASCHGVWLLRMALRMVRSLRMAAVMASLAGLPRAMRRA